MINLSWKEIHIWTSPMPSHSSKRDRQHSTMLMWVQSWAITYPLPTTTMSSILPSKIKNSLPLLESLGVLLLSLSLVLDVVLVLSTPIVCTIWLENNCICLICSKRKKPETKLEAVFASRENKETSWVTSTIWANSNFWKHIFCLSLPLL